MSTGFYADRRVLVTGGASFIGTHLVEKLLERGSRVLIVDDFSSGLRDVTDRLEKEHDELSVVESDVTVKGEVDRVFGDFEPSVVFHLAARHGGRGYIATHPADCAMNMAMDQLVLDASVKHGVDRVCFASSACAYPTDLQMEVGSAPLEEGMVSFSERGGAFADEAYGWAKLMGELSCRAYHEQHGLATSAGRIFTAYGPRENETHAIVALIAKAFVKQDPFEVWGDGSQKRNFTFVEDTAEGLIRTGENVTDGSPVNIGLETSWSINEVIAEIFDRMGWEPDEIDRLTEKPVGVIDRRADCSRSRDVLGWEPSIGLEEGLARTIEWYTGTKDAARVEKELERLLTER